MTSVYNMHTNAELLRVGDDVDQVVGVAFHPVIKTPPPVDPSLRDVLCLVVLLGVEGGVAWVAEEVAELLAEGPLDPLRGVLE